MRRDKKAELARPQPKQESLPGLPPPALRPVTPRASGTVTMHDATKHPEFMTRLSELMLVFGVDHVCVGWQGPWLASVEPESKS